MQHRVYHWCQRPFRFCIIGIRLCPVASEQIEPVTLTFGTRPVSCGKSRRLVQKKEAGISARGHHRMSPALEIEDTCDPTDLFKSTRYLSALIHQTSTVAV